MFLNLELDRSRPRLVIKARFAVAEVEQPGITRGMQLRTPLFLAPFDLETEMEICECLGRRDHAEALARDMDGRTPVDIFDHKDLQRVAIFADWFEIVTLGVAPGTSHVRSGFVMNISQPVRSRPLKSGRHPSAAYWEPAPARPSKMQLNDDLIDGKHEFQERRGLERLIFLIIGDYWVKSSGRYQPTAMLPAGFSTRL